MRLMRITEYMKITFKITLMMFDRPEVDDVDEFRLKLDAPKSPPPQGHRHPKVTAAPKSGNVEEGDKLKRNFF